MSRSCGEKTAVAGIVSRKKWVATSVIDIIVVCPTSLVLYGMAWGVLVAGEQHVVKGIFCALTTVIDRQSAVF